MAEPADQQAIVRATTGNNQAVNGDVAENKAVERVGNSPRGQFGGRADQVFRLGAAPLEEELLDKGVAKLLAPRALGGPLAEERQTQKLSQ